MCISTLEKSSFFNTILILSVEQEHWSTNISEWRVETTSYQDTAIIETDSYWVGLEDQVFGYLFFRPKIFMKIIVHNQVLIVGVSEKVNFRNCLKLVIEKFVSIPVWELDNWVFEIANPVEHLVSNYHVKDKLYFVD